jgi:hypothetical protein
VSLGQFYPQKNAPIGFRIDFFIFFMHSVLTSSLN